MDGRAGRGPAGAASSPPTTSPRPSPAPARGASPAATPAWLGDLLLGHLRLDAAVLPDLAVDVARLDELVVAAAGDDAARLEYDDLVRERDRREAVGDDHRRPAPHRLAQAGADLRLRRGVHRRRCV